MNSLIVNFKAEIGVAHFHTFDDFSSTYVFIHTHNIINKVSTVACLTAVYKNTLVVLKKLDAKSKSDRKKSNETSNKKKIKLNLWLYDFENEGAFVGAAWTEMWCELCD